MPGPLNGLILPHAPLLLPEILENSPDGALERVRASCVTGASIISGPRAVIATPHAMRTGVYVSPYGDLAGFGPRAPATLCPLDLELSEEIARRWGEPLLDEPLDHGIVVPLLLAAPTVPIVAVGFEEAKDPASEPKILAGVLADLGVDGTLVASANLSAGLTDRAPLTRLSGAEGLERRLVQGLRQDVGTLLETAPRLAKEAGSCALGPLGLLGHLFGGRPAEILTHEWPYGVGYLVATIGSDA